MMMMAGGYGDVKFKSTKKKKFRRRFVDKIISECTYVYESGSTFV